jgi:hypothetical protein
MPLTPKGDVSYNVQVAVDSKHHLMVDQEVTNGNSSCGKFALP